MIIYKNGKRVDLDSPLKNGDRIIVVSRVKGAAEVKRKGIWVIHAYDKDEWPSDFHAHEKITGNILNIYSGEIFDKGRRYIGSLNDKDLRFIRTKLAKQKQPIIKEKAIRSLILAS